MVQRMNLQRHTTILSNKSFLCLLIWTLMGDTSPPALTIHHPISTSFPSLTSFFTTPPLPSSTTTYSSLFSLTSPPSLTSQSSLAIDYGFYGIEGSRRSRFAPHRSGGGFGFSSAVAENVQEEDFGEYICFTYR